MEEIPLRFHYVGASQEDVNVAINVGDMEHTYFVKPGEQVADKTRKTNYKVIKFEKAYEEGPERWYTSEVSRRVFSPWISQSASLMEMAFR